MICSFLLIHLDVKTTETSELAIEAYLAAAEARLRIPIMMAHLACLKSIAFKIR